MTELETLVRQAQARDLAAFTALVKRFQAMSIGYAYAILGDYGQAEEAAQESFVRAFLDLGKLQEPLAFPGWFRTIVRHCCYRITRRKRTPTVPLEAAAHVHGPDPAIALEKREIREFVRQAIASLPSKEREAMTLFYINGYSMAEVGEFLEVPVSTIKNRLHSARKKLHERTLHMVEETLKANVPEPDEMAERIVFFAQLAQNCMDGVPLLQALNEIGDTLHFDKLRHAVDAVKASIKANNAFSDALAQFPEIFPTKVVSLVRDGECFGALEIFLEYARAWLDTGQFHANPYAFIGCLHHSHWFGDAMDLGAEAVTLRPEIPDAGRWQGQQVIWLEFVMPGGTIRKVNPCHTLEEAVEGGIEPEPYYRPGGVLKVVRDLKLMTVLNDVQDEEMRGMLRIRLRPQDKHEVLLPITFYPGREIDGVRVELKPVALD